MSDKGFLVFLHVWVGLVLAKSKAGPQSCVPSSSISYECFDVLIKKIIIMCSSVHPGVWVCFVFIATNDKKKAILWP